MRIYSAFFLALPLIAFAAAEKYGIYDLQGSRLSAFEAERYELPEKTRQIKSGYPNKIVYVSSMQKGRGSKPTSRYRFKTGSYVEAARNETFAICPPSKTEGTWISEHSVALNAENCVSIQAPGLAGTIDALFLEGSGKVDTVQVLVDQVYIQMGDYSHKLWVFEPRAYELPANIPYEMLMRYGRYESRGYGKNLIVDKTKFIVADAWRYSKIDTVIARPNLQLERVYKGVNLEESKLPFIATYLAWRVANLRSKMEGLDTVYIRLSLKDARKSRDAGKIVFEEKPIYKYQPDSYPVIASDTSASGYRSPSADEWFYLMRAGASTRYFWGDEWDSLTVSRYAWMERFMTSELRPVARLAPNQFGLYDIIGNAKEGGCYGWDFDALHSPECKDIYWINGRHYDSFRLLRKTPKLQKLEKF